MKLPEVRGRETRMITIDAGNTTVSLAVHRGARVTAERRWASDPSSARSAWERRFAAVGRGPWAGTALASVVPSLTADLIAAARAAFRAPVLPVTPETPLPIRNGYRAPREVGADRLVAAAAAVAECGAPVIIVDFGTAVTVDAVSRTGVYLGGAIFPGLRLSAETLSRGTALLPRLEFNRPRPVRAWGRTTRESLETGIVLGAAGAVSRLVAHLRRELGADTPVVATGGSLDWVAPYCPELRRIRPRLMHDGLRLAWEYSRTGRST